MAITIPTGEYDFKIVRRRGRSYFTFKMEGLDALTKDLARMSGELAGQEGKYVAVKSLEPMAHRVRANVPVDTGLLKESVRQTKGRQDRRGVVASILVGYPRRATAKGSKRAAYALQVEYGTTHRPERPFIRPAFDGHEVELAENVKRWLKLRIIRWKFHQRLGRV